MADEFESNEITMSHKGKRISSYTLKYKLEARAYAKNNSINSASKKFNVERKTHQRVEKQKRRLAFFEKERD